MSWDYGEPPAKVTSNVKRPTICVLLPHTGMWDSEWVEKTWKPLTSQMSNDFCLKQSLLCRVPSLPLARNTLIQNVIKLKEKGERPDYVLWLDSDLVPESPKLINECLYVLWRALENTGEHIATGLYTAKQAHGFNNAIWKAGVDPETKKEGFIHVAGWSGNWFEVDVAGIGFMLMKTKVVEDMWMHGVESGEMPFHWEIPESMSEDFNFLTKARKLFGYKTWCHAGVRLSHLGKLVVESEMDKIKCPKCGEEITTRRFRVPAV